MKHRHEKIGPAPARHGPHPGREIQVALGMRGQIQEREQLHRSEAKRQQSHRRQHAAGFPDQPQAACAPAPVRRPHQADYQPGEKDHLGRARQQLQRRHRCGDDDAPTALAPGAFSHERYQRHPGKGRDVVGPHQRVLHQAACGIDQSGHAGGQPVARPVARGVIHGHARQPEMREHECAQAPRLGQQEVDQRQRVECQRVPLREEGQAGGVERIPEGNFSMPKAFAVEMREGIAEAPVVAVEEGVAAEEHIPERHHHQHEQEQPKPGRSEPGVACPALARKERRARRRQCQRRAQALRSRGRGVRARCPFRTVHLPFNRRGMAAD